MFYDFPLEKGHGPYSLYPAMLSDKWLKLAQWLWRCRQCIYYCKIIIVREGLQELPIPTSLCSNKRTYTDMTKK